MLLLVLLGAGCQTRHCVKNHEETRTQAMHKVGKTWIPARTYKVTVCDKYEVNQ
jgi:hypothetical protein